MKSGYTGWLKDLLVISALTAPALALALPEHDPVLWFSQPVFAVLAMGLSAFMTAGAWLWFTRPMNGAQRHDLIPVKLEDTHQRKINDQRRGTQSCNHTHR